MTDKTTVCTRCGGRGALPVAEPECNGGRCAEPCERCGGTGRIAPKTTRLIDDMLAAQTRLAQAWRDGAPLTHQQKRDEATRDAARVKLMELIHDK